MSESLGEALLYLRTDDRGLEAGIAAAKGKSEGLGRTFDDTSGKAGSLGKAMDLAGGSATRLAMQQGQLTTVAKVQGAGLQQLSGRIGEVGAAYAAGSTPIQIFVAQMGRSTQATTLATGGAGRFTAAMGNPWTMIISTAAVVLLPLIENLFETEDAAKAAELASNGLSDAQSALGQIFDLTTGKIKSQNEMLRLNARLTAANLRAEALAAKTEASGAINEAGEHSWRSIWMNNVPGRRWGESRNTAAKQKLRGVLDGTLNAEDVQQWGERADFSGVNISRQEFMDAVARAVEARAKGETADEITKSLDSGELSPAFRREGRGQTSRAATRGRGSAARAAEDAAQQTERYSRDLAGLQAAALNLQTRLADTAEERFRLESQALDISIAEQKRRIEANADYTDAQKATLLAALEVKASYERELIERRKQEELARQALEIAQAMRADQRDIFQSQLRLADTRKERRDIEMRLLDLTYDQERAALAATIASNEATDAQKAIARARMRVLDQLQAGDQAALDREYASPIERYREDVLKVGKNINDEMESVAVDGLTLLNNGLADVIANAKSLGDVFKGVADQIIAELARIAIQQAIIGPLLGLFGGGGSLPGTAGGMDLRGFGGGGGLFSSIGKFFSGFFADGGLIPTGSFGIVGEAGPEPIFATAGGVGVLPNSALRSGGLGGTNVSIPISIDATGADAAGLARVQSQLDRLQAELPGQIVRTVQDAGERRIIRPGGWQ